MPSRAVARFARGGALVFEFTGTIGGGAILGWFLDSQLGTEPYLLLLFLIVGIVGGFIRLLQVLQRFRQIDSADTPER